MVTMGDHDRNRGLKEMNERFYRWTELIQSSPEAMQESVASVIGGGYRKCNLVLQELRFNPMFRNRRGERDLDHIINAARWGLERALVEYPKVKAGLILMMDRRLTLVQNEIILEKAIKYQGRGIVGIDLAGPDRRSLFDGPDMRPCFIAPKRRGWELPSIAAKPGKSKSCATWCGKSSPAASGTGLRPHRMPG